jgi:hypothetical protein
MVTSLCSCQDCCYATPRQQHTPLQLLLVVVVVVLLLLLPLQW